MATQLKHITLFAEILQCGSSDNFKMMAIIIQALLK
jgi:hypothetical protein